MLSALGMLGVVLAGLALPMAAWGEDEQEDEEGPLPEDGSPPPEDPVSPYGDGVWPPEEEAPPTGDDAAGDAEILSPGPAPDVPAAASAARDGPALDGPAVDHPAPDESAQAQSRADGGPAGERIDGGAGDDDLAGAGGDDTLSGGPGADRLFGGRGDDLLAGGAGDDRLADGSGENTLRGGPGADRLTAMPTDADADAEADGRDLLEGGAGDDTLGVGPSDVARGGPGADSFLLGAALPPPEDGEPPEIADFDPEEDALLVVWDDFAHDAPPEIALSRADDAPGRVDVLADGVPLARLAGGPAAEAAEVALLPASRFPG